MQVKDWDYLITKEGKELGIDKKDAIMAYKSIFRFIISKTKELPSFYECTADEINNLKSSFNIPYLGKLHTDGDLTIRKINRINKYKKDISNKDDDI